MKELFQELNKNLPNSPGPKASKYETISKGKLVASWYLGSSG